MRIRRKMNMDKKSKAAVDTKRIGVRAQCVTDIVTVDSSSSSSHVMEMYA